MEDGDAEARAAQGPTASHEAIFLFLLLPEAERKDERADGQRGDRGDALVLSNTP